MEALPLHGWENFYVIVGSSAAALTGLTFVVITISSGESGSFANSPSARLIGLRAFITPIAVHFCAALWLSVLLSVPELTPSSLAICLGVTGLLGSAYCARVIGWMLKALVNYKPFLEDWIWSAILPTASYVCLLAAALLMPGQPRSSLYMVGGITVLLLFIGIHNAWDVVAWITTERHAQRYRHRQGPHVQDSSTNAHKPPADDRETTRKDA